ncbi:LLM class flavin-dependent oxidoreductase [Pseudarthrobacter enclensis]|uniref:LLM class flavin-dependent oxidoreductase n=1 Tax=Pseudarthrobacter enclensis TaxID=993070 RepID=UPI000AE4F1F2|nr:LLM class flavin-dependent oxidoreductase [Pseudarthrobacter enclensis]
MKKIGFLSFNYWSDQRGSHVRSAGEALHQSVELAVAAEEIGISGAYFRVHHFSEQQANPFPLLSHIAAKTTKLELGTGVIDMRYENPLSLAEQAAATDLLSGERLQLGVSRGSPEHADRGYRYFGHTPKKGFSDADMAREQTAELLWALDGAVIADANPQIHPGGKKLPITPRSATLRERIWWGAGNLESAVWTAQQGMQLMSSTLIQDEKGIPFDLLQLEQSTASEKPGTMSAGTGHPRYRSPEASCQLSMTLRVPTLPATDPEVKGSVNWKASAAASDPASTANPNSSSNSYATTPPSTPQTWS